MNDKSWAEQQLDSLRSDRGAPRVFVSYSYDSPEHKNWVLRLASDLRKNGIDAMLDVWDIKPGEDVARFMEHLCSCDRVVIVCSKKYTEKALTGAGGVGYETMLVTAEILQDRGAVRFVPIIRDNPAKELPPFLRTRLWIDFDKDAEYERQLIALARSLLEVPLHQKPPLGTNPFVPEAEPPRDVLNDNWFAGHRSSATAEAAKRGAFMEISFGLTSKLAEVDQRTLLNIAERSMIHTFGWPIAAVLQVEGRKPRPEADGICAKFAHQGFSPYEAYDYWALRRNGDFYFVGSLFENERDPDSIFFNTRIVRVAESLMYCRNVYENLHANEGSTVRLRVRHCGIQGRKLSTSNPNRIMWPNDRRIAADEAEAVVEFHHPPTDHDIVLKAQELLEPLFVLFDFFQLDPSIYQDVVGNFLQGRCT